MSIEKHKTCSYNYSVHDSVRDTYGFQSFPRSGSEVATRCSHVRVSQPAHKPNSQVTYCRHNLWYRAIAVTNLRIVFAKGNVANPERKLHLFSICQIGTPSAQILTIALGQKVTLFYREAGNAIHCFFPYLQVSLLSDDSLPSQLEDLL
jgi:hypothetical protein